MKKTSLIVILLLISITIISCRNRTADKGKPENPPVPVAVSQVKLSSVTYYDSYPGNIVALKEVEIHAQVGGYITGIFFTEGSRVTKGQKLYEIDRRQYEAAYQQAQNNVKIAESNLDKVQRDYDRYNALSQQDAIAKQQLEHTRSDFENAKLQLSSAHDDLVKAKTNYEFSLITAPFDGTIGISQVKMGALIVSGQTLLNTISSDDPVAADFEIDEKELPYFEELEKAKVSNNDTLYRITLADQSTYMHPGKISLIDRAVDPRTGTITVRLVFPNPDHTLRPGMSCTVQVLHRQDEKQILIPFKAVTEQMGEYFVYRISGDSARQITVLTGVRIGPDVIISSGLKDGDTIVTEGMAKLHNGAKIITGKPQAESSTDE